MIKLVTILTLVLLTQTRKKFKTKGEGCGAGEILYSVGFYDEDGKSYYKTYSYSDKNNNLKSPGLAACCFQKSIAQTVNIKKTEQGFFSKMMESFTDKIIDISSNIEIGMEDQKKVLAKALGMNEINKINKISIEEKEKKMKNIWKYCCNEKDSQTVDYKQGEIYRERTGKLSQKKERGESKGTKSYVSTEIMGPKITPYEIYCLK
jgi:hypothetical protein